jgi:hypothetical protein
MPRLPNNPDRDFCATQSVDDIDADIAELFASRPLTLAELFADQIVRMRIAMLITEAMKGPRPTSRKRVAIRREAVNDPKPVIRDRRRGRAQW